MTTIMNTTNIESEHYPYVCTDCGREVRMAAEIVPDDWDSHRNEGLRFACDCTVQAVDEMDRPQPWVIDTDNELATD